MAGEKDPNRLRKTKLTKGRLKAYLVNKYDGLITEKILRVLNPMFHLNKDGYMTFDDYVNFMSDFVNFESNELFKMAFKIYDFNGNDDICELDIVSFFKTQDSKTELEKIYMNDVNLIINKLKAKTKMKGCENRDLDVTLAKIYKRAGVLHEFSVGDKSNPNQPPILINTVTEFLGYVDSARRLNMIEMDSDDEMDGGATRLAAKTPKSRMGAQDFDTKSRLSKSRASSRRSSKYSEELLSELKSSMDTKMNDGAKTRRGSFM